MRKIVIASDHAGLELKDWMVNQLKKDGFEVLDLGTNSNDSVDYPDFAAKLAKRILKKEFDKGILICGSGIGISISANRFKGIRAALCSYPLMAELSRRHNDANVLCMAGRFIGKELALETFYKFYNTDFDGGRHQRRIDKMENLGN